MSISYGAATLSLPKPSHDLSSLRVLNPSSLPIPRLPIATVDCHQPSTIRMGGGPRTFPGGVSKWQWKRMQAKKAKQLLKARLCRERQLYEMRKRAELQAAVTELERPWEVVERAPALFSVKADEQVKALADRFQRPGGYDLWTETDGPQLFRSPVDGLPSARFFPKGVVHSIKPYGRIAGNSEDGKGLPSLPPQASPAGSVPEAGTEESTESGRRRGRSSRRSSDWRRRGGFMEVKIETGGVEYPLNTINNVKENEELGFYEYNNGADNGMKGRGILFDDHDRRAVGASNTEVDSDFRATIPGKRIGGSYDRSGSSGSRGMKYGNRQRHGSEESYGSDSERIAVGGAESGRSSSVNGGRYNGSNRRFTGEGKEGGRFSSVNRGRHDGSNRRFTGEGEESGRFSSVNRGRYNGSNRRFTAEGEESGRFSSVNRGRYNGSNRRFTAEGEESGRFSSVNRGRYNGSNRRFTAEGEESGRFSSVNRGRYNGSNRRLTGEGEESGRFSSVNRGRYNGSNHRFTGEVEESGKFSSVNRGRYNGSNRQFTGEGEESGRFSSVNRGRYNGSNRRFTGEEEESGRFSSVNRGKYNGSNRRFTGEGEESGRFSSVNRGRCNGSNRRFTGEGIENLSQTDESRRIPLMRGGNSERRNHLLNVGNLENSHELDSA